MRTNALLFAALFTERGVLATLVVVQIIATILAFAPSTVEDIWIHLGVISLFLQLTFLLSLTWLYLLRNQLQNYSRLVQSISLFVSLLATTLLMSFILITFASSYIGIGALGPFIFSNLLIVFLVACLFVQFLTIYFEKQQQTNALARAELDALQARIRPHFLYNSLNTAAELTHYDPDAAEQAILALSALSQAALKVGKGVPLAAEIALTKQYISLESWRFGERLKVKWLLPELLPKITIPYLTIQPIIENAVCYGVEPALDGAEISVQLHQSKQSLTFIIENPIVAATQKHLGNGMALENIRQRLALFYQNNAQLTTTSRDGIFRVKLVLPFAREEGV